MTPETYRSPIRLFDSVTDEDLTRFGIRMGCEYELVLDSRHPGHSSDRNFRDAAAESFMDAIGTSNSGEVTSEYGDQHDGDYENWEFTGDGSLTADRAGDITMEIVSPILDYADKFPTFCKVQDWCQSGRAYTNSSCGLHTGVSSRREVTRREFDPILFSLLVDDHAVLSRCDRLTNTYAPATWRRFFDNLRDNHRTDLRAGLARPSSLRDISSRISDELGLACRNTVNYGHLDGRGYVEYRAPGGDWVNLPKEYMKELFRKVSISFLCASGQLSHPELDVHYATRMAYALRDNAARRGDDLFPSSSASAVIPNVLLSMIGNSFWCKLGKLGNTTYYVEISRNNRNEADTVQLWHSEYESEALFGFTFHADISAEGQHRRMTVGDIIGDGYGHIRNGVLRFIVENNRGRANSTLRAVRLFMAFAQNVSASRTSLTRHLRQKFSGHSFRNYVDAADMLLGCVTTTLEMARNSASRNHFKQSLHTAWQQTVSVRVRMRMIAAAANRTRSLLETLQVSPLTKQVISAVISRAESEGRVLPTSEVRNILTSFNVGRSDIAVKDIMFNTVFPEGGANVSAVWREYLSSGAVSFISANHVLAVFTQKTDAAPYITLRNSLRDLAQLQSVLLPESTTQNVRQSLIDGARRIPRQVRRNWMVTGTYGVLSERLAGRVIRPYVLGEVA